MHVLPIGDRILVRRSSGSEYDDTSVPDDVRDRQMVATVIAMGAGWRTGHGATVQPEFKEGDRILMGRFSGTEVWVEGEEYIVLGPEDVLGVLRPDRGV